MSSLSDRLAAVRNGASGDSGKHAAPSTTAASVAPQPAPAVAVDAEPPSVPAAPPVASSTTVAASAPAPVSQRRNLASQQQQMRDSLRGSDAFDSIAELTQRNLERWRAIQEDMFRAMSGGAVASRSKDRDDDQDEREKRM